MGLLSASCRSTGAAGHASRHTWVLQLMADQPQQPDRVARSATRAPASPSGGARSSPCPPQPEQSKVPWCPGGEVMGAAVLGQLHSPWPSSTAAQHTPAVL